MSYVNKIQGQDASGNTVEAQIMHSYINDSGNLELSNVSLEDTEPDSKVNIVSKSDIQIKPGDDGTIQLDCERNTTTGDPVELSIKVCNGNKDAGYTKKNRVVRSKINVAEITIDNQNAHTTQTSGGSEDVFDIDKIRINFRTDKWKNEIDDEPTRKDNIGPVDVKLRAKSFDIRCHGNQPGGGIALQPCGSDPNGYENKIKFESSRQSPLYADTPLYDTEGGQGLEFGTFNNIHTSLFTEDYRFNEKGIVYAVTRGEPVLDSDSGKYDYPTSPDDFKDIIDDEKGTSWENIVFAGIESDKVISKSGNYKSHKPMIYNTMHIPVYLDSNENIFLCEDNLDVIYDGSGNLVQFGPSWSSKALVYFDDAQQQPVPASSKLFLQDIDGGYWIADIDSEGKLKKWGNDSHNPIDSSRVKAQGEITSLREIQSQGILNSEDNPVLLKIKNIITDPAIDSYSAFATALMDAFGWQSSGL